jgi:high-affinity Fe2+/Pb2+ permease
MAYIDFKMRPPPADTGVAPEAPAEEASARKPAPRGAMWIGAAIAVVVAALIFTLALVSIGEPFVAGLVTVLLLLPAASLLSADDRHHT